MGEKTLSTTYRACGKNFSTGYCYVQKSIKWVVDRKKHVEFYPQTMAAITNKLINCEVSRQCSVPQSRSRKKRRVLVEAFFGFSTLCRFGTILEKKSSGVHPCGSAIKGGEFPSHQKFLYQFGAKSFTIG